MRKRKILVFDDSEVVLEATAAALEDGGYDVVTLSSPALFPATLNKEKPDLVLMDVELPVLHGPMLVSVARANGLHACPIVLYSHRPEEVLRELSVGCGADGFLRKTHDSKVLTDAVAEHLQQWDARHPPATERAGAARSRA